MIVKTKKLQLAKITISRLNKTDMIMFKGGTQFIGCGRPKTNDPLDPACQGSEIDC